MSVTSIYEYALRKRIQKVDEADVAVDLTPAFIKANVALETGTALLKIIKDLDTYGETEVLAYQLNVVTRILQENDEVPYGRSNKS